MVIGSFLSSGGFKFVSYYDVCSNIVIIIKNFRFLRADHKAGIACERHTREMEKSPLSTQCAGIKSSRPDAHMCGDRGFESRPLQRRVCLSRVFIFGGQEPRLSARVSR